MSNTVMLEASDVRAEFLNLYQTCTNVFGYFTCDAEKDLPCVCFIEQVEPDATTRECYYGVDNFYVAHSPYLVDKYIWGEAELEEYLKSHT